MLTKNTILEFFSHLDWSWFALHILWRKDRNSVLHYESAVYIYDMDFMEYIYLFGNDTWGNKEIKMNVLDYSLWYPNNLHILAAQ